MSFPPPLATSIPLLCPSPSHSFGHLHHITLCIFIPFLGHLHPIPLAISTPLLTHVRVSLNSLVPFHISAVPVARFRVGFKHAFRWCPCVSVGEYEGLELRSARFLHTHSSVSKLSRMDTTTVASALGTADEELDEPGRAERLSLDMTSNGSSRSDSKTVSESLSFYSNTLT